MRNSKLIVSVAVSSIVSAGVAFAADLPVRAYTKASPVIGSPAYNWTGFYAGVSAGYNWSRGNVSPRETVVFTDPAFGAGSISAAAAQIAAIPASLSTGANGFIASIQAGYNWQWNRTVLGIEADFSGLSGRGFNTFNTTAPIVGFPPQIITSATSVSRKLDSLGIVRGRIGFAPIDRLLVFATGGLAFGEAKTSISITQTCPIACGISFPNSATGSTSKTLLGWAAGSGMEFALDSSWSVKGEYLHYDLGSLTHATTPLASTAAGPFTTLNVASTANFRGDFVRAGINYRFGGLVVARY